ncbi:hypothetical protein GCM10010052_19250 [Paenarthrobacter histidinolovorans]|nr:hypothetical protein GCM10010052_19250 [Paenarthrobacter histidinolovorans]
MAPSGPWQPVEDWTSLTGFEIEIWDRDRLMDRGVVDTVTVDGAVLWLAQDGVAHRRAVEKDLGRHIKRIAPAT